MGRNGSGKSSLLWALHPAGRRQAGTVTIDGQDARRGARRRRSASCRRRRPTCSTSPRSTRSAPRPTARPAPPAGTCRALLERIVPGLPGDQHPRDLSEGQRLAWCWPCSSPPRPGSCSSTSPPAASTTRPRSGSRELLRELAAEGRAVVVATHDVEFVARPPTGSSCWPRARWWPTAPPPTWSWPRPPSRPRWPRCCTPTVAHRRRGGRRAGRDAAHDRHRRRRARGATGRCCGMAPAHGGGPARSPRWPGWPCSPGRS